MLNYGGTVTVDRSKLKKGVKTAWIPVFIYNGRRRTTGYVQATQVKLSYVYNKKFSSNPIIHRAIKIGFQYLGTPFQMPGDSLQNGIDCAQFTKHDLSDGRQKSGFLGAHRLPSGGMPGNLLPESAENVIEKPDGDAETRRPVVLSEK